MCAFHAASNGAVRAFCCSNLTIYLSCIISLPPTSSSYSSTSPSHSFERMYIAYCNITLIFSFEPEANAKRQATPRRAMTNDGEGPTMESGTEIKN
ncbi:hypothetical protein BDR03DRAFT_294657 [Suillus americanus]|nr:hypothetical protein BDR03DRAFT_294657 [Suillus americanus]